MKQTRNTIYLGLFVTTATAMLVILLLAMGGRGLFTKLATYSMYFNKSVKGLGVGSPVMFRGVRIGQVRSIQFTMPMIDGNNEKTWPIEVIVEIDPRSLDVGKDRNFHANSIIDSTTRDSLIMLKGRKLVDKWLELNVKQNGLCAQLQSLSMLTGQLYIELDFFGDFVPTEKDLKRLEDGVIPTKISVFEQLYLSLQQKEHSLAMQDAIMQVQDFISSGKAQKTMNNLYDISENIRETAASVRRLAEKADSDYNGAMFTLMATAGQAHRAMQGAGEAMETVNARLPGLISAADSAAANFNEKMEGLKAESSRLLESMQKLVDNLEALSNMENGPAAELLGDLKSTSAEARKTLQDMSCAMHELKQATAPDSEERRRLEQTMEQIERAANAFRNLAETLQNNPGSILWGN